MSGADARKQYVGEVTEMCVRYRFLRNDGIAGWFELSNGCNETVKVWHSGSSGTTLGSLSIIRAHGKSESWFDNRKTDRVRYVGCRDQSGGQDVHLNSTEGLCYIYRK